MNMVRAHIRFGAVLALFALALQLWLSFGHFHHTDEPDAVSAHATASLTQPVAWGGAHQPSPDGLLPDDCDICASIALAGTVVHSVAPVLPVPVALAPLAMLPPLAKAVAPPARRVAFQSRAPPSA